MRVLQVLAGAAQGGAETAYVDTCLELSEAGVAIEAVTRPHETRVSALRKAGLKVHELPFGGAVDLWTPYRMRSIIKSFRPDIVQTWMSRAAQKTPAWSPSMGIPRYALLARLGGYYNLKYYKGTDFFMTITPDIRQYLIDKGIAPERVRHINNFADFKDEPGTVNRSALGVPEGAPLLLALGRLHKSKAFDTLIQAVAQAPGIYLWIAGEGPDRAVLEGLIASLGVGDRVKLLGWRDDRGPLFRAADICVFPSRYEPFGTVFVQAWAQKTPLITTDAAGPKQFVRDGEDALLVPIDDISRLAEAIMRLAGDPVLALKLAERGYERYMAEFSRDKTVAAYLDYFADIRAFIDTDSHSVGGPLRSVC
ncbi:MAG: glycosyltransferase [Alphaproteobacteria bacterium]|nr:glycosyltransferase [Alphaproteobacteria bacterium]